MTKEKINKRDKRCQLPHASNHFPRSIQTEAYITHGIGLGPAYNLTCAVCRECFRPMWKTNYLQDWRASEDAIIRRDFGVLFNSYEEITFND